MRPWLAMALIGGCDSLFDIEHIDTQLDGSLDAPSLDAPLSDWDGDGVPDVDDDCPAIANAAVGGSQPDGDGDGVGDACDPHPNTSGDAIVDFMLGGMGFDTVWRPADTGWLPGELAVTSPPIATSPRILDHAPIGLTHPTLEVGLTVTELGDPGNRAFFAARILYGASTADCSFVEDDSNGTTELYVGVFNGMAKGANVMPEVEVGGPLVLRLNRGDPDNECRLGGNSITYTDDDTTNGVMTPRLVLDGMRVDIAYVVLYTLAP